MATIAFNQVSKRYDENTTALNALSLQIDDGEFIVLVGPSGCGKSTVLRLLAGLEQPSEGEIAIDDKVVNDLMPQQRNIAMVFQNYALYPHMSVRDNLAFPLRMQRMSKQAIDTRINEIAQLLNLAELLQRRPKQLSGGQKQRVAMGRALVRDPSVFLLDEPLSNLDAKLRSQIRADIAQLQLRLRKTTIYVTHDQIEAMTLGHRVAVMNRGELQQIGTPEQLYNRPQNIFVAGFIGNPGMNIATTEVFAQNNDLNAAICRQTLHLPSAVQGYNELSQSENVGYIGVRPEAFRLSKLDGRVALKAYISAVEYLGAESLVYFQLSSHDKAHDNTTWIARITGHVDATIDQSIEIFLDPGAIHWFNSDGSNAIFDTCQSVQPRR